MPFLLPAAASAVAAAAPAAAAAGASAAASAGIGATLTSIAGNVLMNVAISAAMSIFQPQVGVAGRTFEWTLDPDGPIPFAAGRIGVPGSAVYRKTFGPDLMYYGIPSVLSGAGPIDGYEAFLADDESVTFDGSGKAVSSQYAGELWYKNKLGTQPDTAITSQTGLKNGATLPGWTSAHKLSGKACYMIVMGENSKGSAFPTGEIKPLITLRGLKVYDPRLDSTYPGGSGSHRLANPATWTYSANPILWALKWTLGLWEGPNGKGAPQVDYQVGGIGAKLSGIDVPAFVAAANVADANGWTCAAYPTTDDDKHQVLTGFLQAGGAIYAQRAGKISCIQRAAPRTSIVTVSAYDTAGPLEIDTAASRIDRINTLRPRFWSEPHRWQMTALDQEVTAQAYRDEDGGVRPAGIDYPYVTNARQAGQLAALQIANTREGIAGVIPLKPHLQRIRPGDAFTITEAGFVLNGLKCLCLNTDYDPATGVVRVSFVSETDAKYPFALGQNPTPPTPQVLTPVDPRFVSPPGAGDWTVTPRPPSPGGGQLPGFDISGVVGNDTATAIIVEFGTSATGPWKQAYQGPPTVTNIPLDGLQPGVQYWVAIQYQRNQNYSERHVYGPYLAPELVAGNVSPSGSTILAVRADIDALADKQASDNVIRAEEISALKVTAKANPNVMENPSGEDGLSGWAGSGWGAVNAPQLGGRFYARTFTGQTVSGFQPFFYDIPWFDGAAVTASWRGELFGLLGGDVNVYIEALDANHNATLGAQSAIVPLNTPTGRNSLTLPPVPVGTRFIRFNAYLFNAQGDPGYAEARLRQIKIEAGSEATLFNADGLTSDLAAEVGIQKLAVFDLEAQQALARLRLYAEASGGLPALFDLFSSALGSGAAIIAPIVALINNQAGGGDPLVALEARNGEAFFGRPIYVAMPGTAYHLIVGGGGPAGSQWLLWFGPNTINASVATRTNGALAFGTDGLPYVGSAPLGDGLIVNASPLDVGGSRVGSGVATSDPTSLSVTGGLTGASIRWSNVGGDTTVYANSPNSGTTTFSANIAVGQLKSAFMEAKVVKSGKVSSVVVGVTLYEESYVPPEP